MPMPVSKLDDEPLPQKHFEAAQAPVVRTPSGLIAMVLVQPIVSPVSAFGLTMVSATSLSGVPVGPIGGGVGQVKLV